MKMRLVQLSLALLLLLGIGMYIYPADMPKRMVFVPVTQALSEAVETFLARQTSTQLGDALLDYDLRIRQDEADLTLETSSGETVLHLSLDPGASAELRITLQRDRTTDLRAEGQDWNAFLRGFPLGVQMLAAPKENERHPTVRSWFSANTAPLVPYLCTMLFLLILAGFAFAYIESEAGNRRTRVLSLAALGALALLAWSFAVSGLLPVAWITPVHVVELWELPEMLLGRGCHSGVCWWAVAKLAPDGTTPLRAVVGANLALAVLNSALVLLIARRFFASWVWAALFTLLVVTLPVFRITALSEFPTQIVLFLTLASAVQLALVTKPTRPSAWHVAKTGLCLLLAIALAGLIREELLLLGVPVAGVFLLVHALGPQRSAMWCTVSRDTFLGSLSGKGPALRRLAKVLVGALSVYGIYVLLVHLLLTPLAKVFLGEGSSHAQWLVEALHTTALAEYGVYDIGAALERMTGILPVGFFIFSLIGSALALANGARWFGLPIAALFLNVLFLVAARSQEHDTLRLMSQLFGVWLLFGLHGLTPLVAYLRRMDTPFRYSAPFLILPLLFAVGYPSWQARLESQEPVSPDLLPYHSGWTLDSDNQYLTRFLVADMDRHPNCTYVQYTLEEKREQPTQRLWQVWSVEDEQPQRFNAETSDVPLGINLTLNAADCLLYVHSPEASPALLENWGAGCLEPLDAISFLPRPYMGVLRARIAPAADGYHRLAIYRVNVTRPGCRNLPTLTDR